MKFRSGSEFEFAVFGESATFFGNRVLNGTNDFSKAVANLISQEGLPYPNTPIGFSLYFYTKQYLEGWGVDCAGFIFRQSINTRLDSRHFSDGFFFVPSIGRYPVTIDVFNLESDLEQLKERWLDTFEGQKYGEVELQSDLFSFKKGLSVSNTLRGREETFFPSKVFDPRVNCRRPENHFILTPYHTKDYRCRRVFAKMVAKYLATKAPCSKTGKNKP